MKKGFKYSYLAFFPLSINIQIILCMRWLVLTDKWSTLIYWHWFSTTDVTKEGEHQSIMTTMSYNMLPVTCSFFQMVTNESLTGSKRKVEVKRTSWLITCPGVIRSASMHVPCTQRSWPAFLQSSYLTVQRVPDHSGEQVQLQRHRITIKNIEKLLVWALLTNGLFFNLIILIKCPIMWMESLMILMYLIVLTFSISYYWLLVFYD